MANTCGLQEGKSFSFNGNFKGKRPGVLELNKKVIVRQNPCSLYQAPCSGASIALIGIDFRPETAEKIAPPCMARLDVDNCIHNQSQQITIAINVQCHCNCTH